MGFGLPIELPPSHVDIATSRLIRRHATPFMERAGKVVTFAADEKPLLAGAVLYWLYGRASPSSPRRLARADHLLVCVAVSAALPHVLKLLVTRQRPDRKLMHGVPRHGIPYSGDPNASFPSGHAAHLGAIAAGLTRTASPSVAAIGWASALALAGTRLLLLAHYLTDVLSGLAIGAAIEAMIAWITKRRSPPSA
jgi:membrane-associated phospholipid phosphatase